MGTNYYAKHPGQSGEGLHIGKHSGGWEFLFRAHPEFGLASTAAWHRFLDHPWVTIVTEYGVETTASEFWEAIDSWSIGDAKRQSGVNPFGALQQWRDAAGFPFAEYEFC